MGLGLEESAKHGRCGSETNREYIEADFPEERVSPIRDWRWGAEKNREPKTRKGPERKKVEP